ncbi:MAG TPA: DcaP family trimeric outer membrane transporter [Alphaproteobacteria bacterium]|nr:DcaP family trimeric outer membrane transporter [Alphaproteobacteria bacterium]
MFNKSLRTALLGSGAAFALMAGPALAGQADDLQAQIDSLQARLDQLEKQKASVETTQVAAPADAVVGGDYPGSWKLPGSDTSMSIHGYIKADFLYDFDQFLGDTFANTSIAGNHTANAHQGGFFHFNARQTRFNIETRTPTDWGQLKTFVEMDFYGTNATRTDNIQSGGGNTSNVLRMRHAYGQLGPVLAGQTWSNFDDVDDLPEQLDFNGGQGEAAGRQTQLRYVAPLGKWTLSGSIENYQPRITAFTAPAGSATTFTGCGILTTSGGGIGNCTTQMPDITGRVQYADTWGHVSLSGVLRDFNYNDGGSATNSSTAAVAAIGNKVNHTAQTFGGGVMLGTNIAIGQWFGGPFAKDYVGATGSYGAGDERYFDTGAVTPGLDAAALSTAGPGGTFSISIKTIDHYTVNAWYQHWWTDNVRTSLVYGSGWWGYGGIPRAVDTGAVDTSQYTQIQTAYINLIWSPVKSVNIGLEFMYGDLDKRGLGGFVGPCGTSQCGGNNGEAKRLMASFQYVF